MAAKALLRVVQAGAVLLAIWGLATCQMRWRDWFLISPVLYYLAVFAFTYVEHRYFVPVMPFILVFAVRGTFHALATTRHS